jgi:UDP-GlcNAc:undecaprenyl-phosphate/decaprenyl-phosphate GlcNAc-1-phosphate transferase
MFRGFKVDLLILAATLAALIGSFLIGRNAEFVGKRLGLIDSPDFPGGRKQHSHPTPLVGGLAVCLAGIGAAIITTVWRVVVLDDLAGVADVAVFAVAVAAMLLIGVADDRHALSARTRLAASILLLLVILSNNPMYSLSELRFSGQFILSLGSMGLIFTLICGQYG